MAREYFDRFEVSLAIALDTFNPITPKEWAPEPAPS